jgi:hypothetical protein
MNKTHALVCIRIETKLAMDRAKKVKAEPYNSVIERALEALNNGE